jgi:hypothetical protein
MQSSLKLSGRTLTNRWKLSSSRLAVCQGQMNCESDPWGPPQRSTTFYQSKAETAFSILPEEEEGLPGHVSARFTAVACSLSEPHQSTSIR